MSGKGQLGYGLFPHPSPAGRVGRFRLLAATRGAAVDILVRVHVGVPAPTSSGCARRSGVLGHVEIPSSTIMRTCHTLCPTDCAILYSQQQCACHVLSAGHFPLKNNFF